MHFFSLKNYVVAPMIAPEMAPVATAVPAAAAAALEPATTPTRIAKPVKINLLFGALGSLQGMVEMYVPDFPAKGNFSQVESRFTKQNSSPV